MFEISLLDNVNKKDEDEKGKNITKIAAQDAGNKRNNAKIQEKKAQNLEDESVPEKKNLVNLTLKFFEIKGKE